MLLIIVGLEKKRKNRKIRDTDKVNAEVSNVDIFKNQKDITIVEKGETSIDFKKIGINGIGKEMLNISKISTRSQKENSYSFLSCNSKSSKTNDCTDEILNTQDGELVDILEELGNEQENMSVMDKEMLRYSKILKNSHEEFGRESLDHPKSVKIVDIFSPQDGELINILEKSEQNSENINLMDKERLNTSKISKNCHEKILIATL